MRRLFAGIATTVLTLGPAFGAFSAEALAQGTYLVDLGGGVVAEVTVDESGMLTVSSVGDTYATLDIRFQWGTGGFQDEFTLIYGGTSYYVDLNVADDGSYEVVVDGTVVPVPSGDEPDPVPTDEEADDAGAATSDAPGQHGRDNARDRGGKAHGHGAEGTTPQGD